MRFSINLTESDLQITQKIVRELKKEITPRFIRSVEKIKRFLPELIEEKIAADPTWLSLMNGRLRQELGLEFPQAQLLGVLKELLSDRSIPAPEILTKSAPRHIIGRVTFWAVPSDYSNLIDCPYASYISPPSGEKIEWLKYVLTSGNKPIFKNIKINHYSKPVKRSRAGFALMRKAPGASYILGEGTPKKNFLKTLMKDVEKEFGKKFIIILAGLI